MATYSEPPFQIVPKTSPHEAMAHLRNKFCDINVSVHFLDVLSSVFGDMCEERTRLLDPWHQYPVTKPRSNAVLHYKYMLQLLKLRRKGHPKQSCNANYCFKHDEPIL